MRRSRLIATRCQALIETRRLKPAPLKRQAQRELHVARVLRAGDLAEALRRAEQSTGPDRRVEVGMVEEIKNVEPELEPSPFANRKFLSQRRVEIVQAGSNHDV